MEKFDESKELSSVVKWVTIMGGIIGIGKFLNFDIPTTVFVLIIIFILVQFNIKDKETEHYKEQANRFESLYQEELKRKKVENNGKKRK